MQKLNDRVFQVVRRMTMVGALICLAFMIGCAGGSEVPKDFLEEVKFADIKMFGPFTTQGNAVLVGGSGDVQIFINNDGDKAANELSAGKLIMVEPYAFKGGSYPGTGGTCGVTLEAGQKCSIILTFTPMTEEPQPLALHITYHDGRGVRSVLGKVEARGIRGAAGSLDQTFSSTGFVSHSIE